MLSKKLISAGVSNSNEIKVKSPAPILIFSVILYHLHSVSSRDPLPEQKPSYRFGRALGGY
ncbi:MAG: hypothetical protein LBC27_03435 [Spirochaetaceae bacterium]|nr:hypothetical protein [Spirochaetaceae bacterium]